MANEPIKIEAVLRELQIDESELEDLITDGDLHPTSEGTSRRFDPEEVHEIKQRKEGYPTMPMPDLEDLRELLEQDDDGDEEERTPS